MISLLETLESASRYAKTLTTNRPKLCAKCRKNNADYTADWKIKTYCKQCRSAMDKQCRNRRKRGESMPHGRPRTELCPVCKTSEKGYSINGLRRVMCAGCSAKKQREIRSLAKNIKDGNDK